MKWLANHFADLERAPVERATEILHDYIVGDSKILAIFGTDRVKRLEFEALPLDVAKPPYLYIQPELVRREAEPGSWADTIRVRVTLRIEWGKGSRLMPLLPAGEPGILTLVNYIVGRILAPGARQLSFTPPGKTQARPFATRVDPVTVATTYIEVPNTDSILKDFVIDVDYKVELSNNGWQASAMTSGS